MSAVPSSESPNPPSPTNAWEMVAPRIKSSAYDGVLAAVFAGLTALGGLLLTFIVFERPGLAFTIPALSFVSAMSGFGAAKCAFDCLSAVKDVKEALSDIPVKKSKSPAP